MADTSVTRVSRIDWDGHEVTIYFDKSPEPFGEREFKDGTNTRYLFSTLNDLLDGIAKAYEAAQTSGAGGGISDDRLTP